MKKIYCNFTVDNFFFFAATIDVDTHTGQGDILLLTDRNESTCMQRVAYQPIHIIAELRINVSINSIPDKNVILEILIPDMECNNTVTFFSTSYPSNCNGNRKVNQTLGEMLPSMPNSNACYFNVPIDCIISSGETCQIQRHFALRTNGLIRVCEIRQG